ncbi:MAG: hypothetical protein STSR0008_03930 [Ignavibacterium sp.]
MVTQNDLTKMTRTELIKKMINFAGVQEKDAKQFVELFLFKLASELNNDQIFYHEHLGYFYIQKISTENKNEDILSNVIFYSTTNNFYNLSKTLLFNIPSTKNQISDETESYFSLSIGKPTIPKDKMNEYETFAYLSEYETRSLLESKVERLFKQGKVLNENENKSPNKKNINNKDFENELENLIQNDEQDIFSFEEDLASEIPWDFGKDWKQEFDEDSILNSEDEQTTQFKFDKINEEEFSWDFGFIEEDEQKEIDKKNNLSSKEKDFSIHNNDIEKNIIENEQLSNKNEIKEENNDKVIEDKFEKPIEPEIDDFKLVKTRTRELKIDLSEFWGSTPSGNESVDDKSDFQSYEDFILEEERKWESTSSGLDISSEKEIQNESLKFEKISSQKIIESREKNLQKESVSSDYIKQEEKKEKQIKTIKTPDLVKDKQWESTPTRKVLKEQKKIKKYGRLKKEKEPRRSNIFYVVLSAIFIVIIFFIVYWKMYGIPTWLYTSPKVNQNNISKSNPVIIERDYDIPVNYPYKITEQALKQKEEGKIEINSDNETSVNKKNENNISNEQIDESTIFSKRNINNQIFSQMDEEIQHNVESPNEKNDTKSIQENKTTNELTKSDDRIYTNTGELIYKTGNNYTVQLSSWQSKDKANQIINKLISQGYDAYIEEINLNNERWYRVKVRNFKSVEEIKNFISKNR